MKTLFRNCLHSNYIYLIEASDLSGSPTDIIKSSSSPLGINSLKNELNGLKWYNSLINSGFSFEIIHESETYLKIKTEFISGKIFSYTDGFIKNKKYITNLVKHYSQIWPKSKNYNNLFALHGDLSICNIIYNQNLEPNIIDWEHFNDKSAPIGFDALNLLFEQVWIETQFNSNIDNMIDPIVSLIQLLKNKGAINAYFLESPLFRANSFLKKNNKIWGEQITKLPLFKFKDSLIKSIDNKIMEKL